MKKKLTEEEREQMNKEFERRLKKLGILPETVTEYDKEGNDKARKEKFERIFRTMDIKEESWKR